MLLAVRQLQIHRRNPLDLCQSLRVKTAQQAPELRKIRLQNNDSERWI
jgi:hypothetical protein